MGFLDRFRGKPDENEPVEKIAYQTTKEVKSASAKQEALEQVERVEYSEPTTKSARVAVKRAAGQAYREAREVGGAAQGIAREVLAEKRTGAAAFLFGRGKTKGKGKKGKKFKERYTYARGYVSRQFKPLQRADARQFYADSVRDNSNGVGPQSERLELPQHFGSVPNWHRVSSARLFDDFAAGSPIEKYGGGGGLPRFFDSPSVKRVRLGVKRKGMFG